MHTSSRQDDVTVVSSLRAAALPPAVLETPVVPPPAPEPLPAPAPEPAPAPAPEAPLSDPPPFAAEPSSQAAGDRFILPEPPCVEPSWSCLEPLSMKSAA